MKIADARAVLIKQHEALERAQARHERARKWLDKQWKKWGDYPQTLFGPIAEELVKHFPGYRYEISGPFGICCEMMLTFAKEGVDAEEVLKYRRGKWEGPDPEDQKTIIFTMGDVGQGEFSIRDYSENMGRFATNTIGAMNGMNHPEIPVPADWDVVDLLLYIQ